MIATNIGSFGKLPYPRFLQVTPAEIFRKDELVWSGKCYLSYRKTQEKDSAGEATDILAKATFDEDLGCILGDLSDFRLRCPHLYEGGMSLFLILGSRAAYNPDGSFHHMSLDLGGRVRDKLLRKA